MCTNKYSNKERYDKVIAKTNWCSFLCLSVVTEKLLSPRQVHVRFVAHIKTSANRSDRWLDVGQELTIFSQVLWNLVV